MTLAFRRWPQSAAEAKLAPLPAAGLSYRYQAGSVRREGRIVEVIRPVAVTLKEYLHDPPCCVGLTLRWRIESVPAGVAVRLFVDYRLNHAAALRSRHWDRRLSMHFKKQFTYLSSNLRRIQDLRQAAEGNGAKRDLIHF